MASQAPPPPPPPVGPPADYFMTPPPASGQLPESVPGFALPQPQQPQQPPVYQPPAWQSGGYAPAAVGVGAGLGLMSQFTGTALSSCIVGLITIVVPLAFGYAFYILPIAGILSGLRAIQRGKVIGGATGIGLNLVGGLITFIALHG